MPTSMNPQYADIYNDCDKQVLQSAQKLGQPGRKECKEAYPPLNSGDGLISQDFSVYEPNILSSLVAYSQRGKILDKDGNTVVIKNEAFSITALLFARDKATLEEILGNTTIQAFKENKWTTKRTLDPTEYAQLSNIRTYHSTDCGYAFARFKQSWKLAIKLETIAKAGLRVRFPPGSPRPSPDSFLTATPSDPLSPDGGLLPQPVGNDERLLQDMIETAMDRAVKDLEAAASSAVGNCPDKILP